jgi:hypothetical protein
VILKGRRSKSGRSRGVSVGLALDLGQSQKELTEAKEALQWEVVVYDNERLAANLVCDDLGVPQPPEMSSLAARITLISDLVRELERGAFQACIHHTFAIARSHYVETINLEAMRLGYAPGYEVEELEKIEDDVALL